MAQRRMFSPDIVCSEEFTEMPPSSRELYFQLGMRADDDGFIQPKSIIRSIGAKEDDLKVLAAKRFVLPFETGVVVIKHWLIHNMLRADRYKATRFLEEKSTLYIKPNKAYTDNPENGVPLLATKWQPSGNHLAPQVRLGKVSIEIPPAPEDGKLNKLDKLFQPSFSAGEEEHVRAPKKKRTSQTDIIAIWNKYPNWKATGSKATPKNPSVIKELLPPAKDVQALVSAIIRKSQKYSLDDFDVAIRAYATEIANRTKDAKGFYLHRFTLYEFLTHANIFERYVTR